MYDGATFFFLESEFISFIKNTKAMQQIARARVRTEVDRSKTTETIQYTN
jgi:hypothetical protein